MVLLALDPPLRSPSGSYWYAGFPVLLGPTSRDTHYCTVRSTENQPFTPMSS